MSHARVAQKSPYVLDLDAGTYWWCRCGRSKSQPFCDGSHKDTEFAPVKLELATARKVVLCGCKQTDDQPYCDGSHSKID